MFQSEAAECGIACLGTIARHHGHESDLATLRRRFGVSIKGATLSQLMKIAGELQMGARPLKLDMEHLPALQLPCILHWDFNHFVVLQKVGNGRATIHDPAVGRRVLPLEELGKHFTGVALELRPAPGFQKVAVSQSLPVSSLWKGLSRTKRTLAQIFALSLVLQLFALLAPLFLQLTVDQVLPSAERNLLVVLGLGFLLLVLIQTATEALRGWILVQLGAAVNLQMQANLFHHLLRLPLTFFERRHLGDIVSRFGSLDAVQRALTNSFIEALVDGVMIVVALILMLLYSPLLTGICVFTVLLYALGRWALFAPLRSASYEELQRAARLQSHFLESIRGVQVLKLFNRTADRESAWQNLFVHRLNAQIQVARLGVGFMAYSHLLQGFLNVLVIWLGARAVIAGISGLQRAVRREGHRFYRERH
jgi:ATP-binding cassette subfamily B protein RaxB